jgi:hypothetical protein
MEYKKVSIVNPTETSNVLKTKERKMRVQTHTWDIDDCELSHETQLDILMHINLETSRNKYINIFINNLKNKICGYKQQDIFKQKFDSDNFVNLQYLLFLLRESNLLCCYCHKKIYILYKEVREMSQWTLDRIDNDLGHNVGNLVISCLKCNLKRRRINKNSFMLTKNMTIKRENYNFDNCEENNFNFDETQTRIIHVVSSTEKK